MAWKFPFYVNHNNPLDMHALKAVCICFYTHWFIWNI